MNTNEKIEKFISDNFHSKIVCDLFEANEKRDRQAFARSIKNIRECIEIQDQIGHIEGNIKYHSLSIKGLREEMRNHNKRLKQLKNGYDYADEDEGENDLFAKEGLYARSNIQHGRD